MNTIKHYPGKHEQSRHGWRFGSNVKLSKLRNQKKKHGESEWDEYKKRARERSGSKPAKDKNVNKTVAKVKAIINKPKSDYEDNTQGGYDAEVKAKKYGETLDKAYSKQWANMSTDQRVAMKKYTNGGYATINKKLRSGGGVGWPVVQDLDSILTQGSLPSDTILSRSFTPDGGVNSAVYKQLAGLQKGAVWSDMAYTSTSLRNFDSWAPTGGRVSFRIRAPKGTKGIYAGKNSNYSTELEFLLGRNQPLYVNSVENVGNGDIILDVTALPYKGK